MIAVHWVGNQLDECLGAKHQANMHILLRQCVMPFTLLLRPNAFTAACSARFVLPRRGFCWTNVEVVVGGALQMLAFSKQESVCLEANGQLVWQRLIIVIIGWRCCARPSAHSAAPWPAVLLPLSALCLQEQFHLCSHIHCWTKPSWTVALSTHGPPPLPLPHHHRVCPSRHCPIGIGASRVRPALTNLKRN